MYFQLSKFTFTLRTELPDKFILYKKKKKNWFFFKVSLKACRCNNNGKYMFWSFSSKDA